MTDAPRHDPLNGPPDPDATLDPQLYAAEVLGTLMLVVFVMVANTRLQPYTPLCNPVLPAVLVWLEVPLSGASTNPARSFGPALVSGDWRGFWICIAGPCLGALLTLATLHAERLRHHRPMEARLCHFRHPARTA